MYTDRTNLYRHYRPLLCPKCGKDLLLHPDQGVITYVKEASRNKIVHVIDFYWVCKGDCEKKMNEPYEGKKILGREKIIDLMIPYNFIHFMLGNFQVVHGGYLIYEKTPFENFKFFMSRLAQLVFRQQESEEIEQIDYWE